MIVTWTDIGFRDGLAAQVVVGSPSTPTPGERVIIHELETLGMVVSLVDDDAAASASGVALVVVSPSATDAGLAYKYKNATAPVIALASPNWTELAMTSAGAGGANYNTSLLLVVDPTSPLAVNLPTSFAPAEGWSTLQSVNDPYLPAGADLVAERSSTPDANVVYTVPGGDVRSDGTVAPAHRVVMGLTESTLVDLSADGYQLFDNAVFWTVGTVPNGQAQGAPAAGTLTLRATFPLNALKPADATHAWKWTQNATKADDYAQVAAADYLATTPPLTDTSAFVRPGAIGVKGGSAHGNFAFQFPGWKTVTGQVNGAGHQMVDADASLLSAANRSYYDPNLAGDTSATDLNRPFRIDVWIRPTANRANLSQNASPNVTQLGMSNDEFMWKVSMYKSGRPLCQWRGTQYFGTSQTGVPNQVIGDFDTADRDAAFNANGAYSQFHVQCQRTAAGVYQMKVWGLTDAGAQVALLASKTYPLPANLRGMRIDVPQTANLLIGKRFPSTDADDAYSGAIDNVQIWSAT